MARTWWLVIAAMVSILALDLWAVLLEPPTVALAELDNHLDERVVIEGTLATWRWADGAERRQALLGIVDETGAASEFRWDTAMAPPAAGSRVRATGDVVAWNARVWVEGGGPGAVEVLAPPDGSQTSLAALAAAPADDAARSMVVTGWLTGAVPPDGGQTSLADLPGGALHRLDIQVAETGNWLEAGDQVRVSGQLAWDASHARWLLTVGSDGVQVLDPAVPRNLDWVDLPERLRWSVDELVALEGIVATVDGSLVVRASDASSSICALGGAVDPTVDTRVGRVVWSVSGDRLCLDLSTGDGS